MSGSTIQITPKSSANNNILQVLMSSINVAGDMEVCGLLELLKLVSNCMRRVNQS